jgi:hypothetical protein
MKADLSHNLILGAQTQQSSKLHLMQTLVWKGEI